MKNRKWIWLFLGIASLVISGWLMARPYEIKASDRLLTPNTKADMISKVAFDSLLILALAIFGIFCLFKFVKHNRADKRQQQIFDDFGKD